MADTKVISRKSLFKSPFLELKEDKVLINRKTKATYHNVYRRPVVMVFPLTEKYDVYLLSEYRYLYEKWLVGAVAGFVEDNEAPLHAAKRELAEETGLTADVVEELLRLELSSSVIKSTVHLFLAKGITEGEPNREEGEEMEILKMPLDEAVKKAMGGEIQNATTIAGILFLDKLRKEKKI